MEIKNADFWETNGDDSTPERFGLRRQIVERVDITFIDTERSVIRLAHLLADFPRGVSLNGDELTKPGNMA